MQMVGMQGFEPWTSPTPRVRATGLRHIPTVHLYYTTLVSGCQDIGKKFLPQVNVKDAPLGSD
jgi:hypothetical protein